MVAMLTILISCHGLVDNDARTAVVQHRAWLPSSSSLPLFISAKASSTIFTYLPALEKKNINNTYILKDPSQLVKTFLAFFTKFSP